MGKMRLVALIVILAGAITAAEDVQESSTVPSDITEENVAGSEIPTPLAVEPFLADASSGIRLIEASENTEAQNGPLAAPGVTKIVVEKITYTWTIKNFGFNDAGFGQAIYSPKFWGPNSKDHEWQLSFFPRGSDPKSKNGAGLFLTLFDKKDVRATVTMSITKNGKRVHRMSYTNTFKGSGIGYANFISQTYFEESYFSNVLSNGDLILGVEITFTPKTKKSSNQCTGSTDDDDECTAMPYDNYSDSDLHLYVEEKNLPAHKATLAAHSRWFAKQLRKNPFTDSITLPDNVEHNAMEEALKFIYTGKINPEYPDDVLALANQLGMQKLKTYLEQAFCLSGAPTPGAPGATAAFGATASSKPAA